METRTLHVPPGTSLPGAAHLGDVPFVMVGDGALPLKPYLMRPYCGQNLTHQKQLGRHMAPAGNMGGNRASSEACNVREVLCSFSTLPEAVCLGRTGWCDNMTKLVIADPNKSYILICI